MLQGTVNEEILLSATYSEWDTNLYPRVKLYNDEGAELGVSPKDLSHVANGYYYSKDWQPSTAGYYQAVYITYTDAGYTTSSNKYGIASEAVKIDATSTDITWISSQVKNVFPSAAIIVHGDNYWKSGAGGGGTIDLSSITPELDYISSQMVKISSQIQSSTYGGGGKSYIIPGGKKSPWTHEQRDRVIKATTDTKEIVKRMEKDLEKYHENEVKLIEKIISQLRTLQARLEKAKTDEEYKEIQDDIVVMTKMLYDLMPEEARDRFRKKL